MRLRATATARPGGVRIYDTELVKRANPVGPCFDVRAKSPCDKVRESSSVPRRYDRTTMTASADGGVDLMMVTMRFDAADPGALQSVLARYVVVSRGHPGCRNIDFALSSTTPDRFVIIQKWESGAAQRAHFDSADMVRMAESCAGLLAAPPLIDLLESISAHDLE